MSNSMTNEEAIAKLEVYSSTNGSGQCTSDEHQEAKELAIKALKKQIPKKPEQGTTNAFIYACPTCGGPVGSLEVEEIWCDFCPKCGQAIDKSLDWSDEE